MAGKLASHDEAEAHLQRIIAFRNLKDDEKRRVGEPADPIVLDPERIRCIMDAFDEAWAQVQASGHVCATDRHAADTRFQLASRIMEFAQSGESDAARLTARALASLFPLGLSS